MELKMKVMILFGKKFGETSILESGNNSNIFKSRIEIGAINVTPHPHPPKKDEMEVCISRER